MSGLLHKVTYLGEYTLTLSLEKKKQNERKETWKLCPTKSDWCCEKVSVIFIVTSRLKMFISERQSCINLTRRIKHCGSFSAVDPLYIIRLMIIDQESGITKILTHYAIKTD